MKKTRLLASTANPVDMSFRGFLIIAMWELATAAPTATGSTLIFPDGTMRYISREEADRFAFGPDAGEVRQ